MAVTQRAAAWRVDRREAKCEGSASVGRGNKADARKLEI